MSADNENAAAGDVIEIDAHPDQQPGSPQRGPLNVGNASPQPGPSHVGNSSPQPGPSHARNASPQPGPSHVRRGSPQLLLSDSEDDDHPNLEIAEGKLLLLT
jgi:hypothetical protein